MKISGGQACRNILFALEEIKTDIYALERETDRLLEEITREDDP